MFHISYRKILSQFSEAGGYAYRKQIDMLNNFSDSIRERQLEKRQISPKEEKRLRNRNEELESKIEKLSNTKPEPTEEKVSFFEKLRNRGTLADEKVSAQIVRASPVSRSVPIITKNVSSDKHSDIKPFQGSWQYPRSDLLTMHPK